MSHQFFEHYALLGLKPGAGWHELKSAYRAQIRKWHPDRFPSDADARKRAEEHSKAINQAYQELTEFYRQHSALPLDTQTASTTRSFTEATPSTLHNEGHPPADASPLRSWYGPAWLRARYGTAFVAAILCAWLLIKLIVPTEEPSTSHPITPPPTQVAVRESQPRSASEDHFFTYGSSMGDVYAAQGVPTSADHEVWHYGASKIVFRNGVVIRWEEHPDNPLKTGMGTSRSSANPPTVFSKGSTKAEVRSIQGNPIREGDKTWDYSVSRVFFENDRVVDWYDSPIDPLKVKR